MKILVAILILFLSCGNQSTKLAKPQECEIEEEVCDEIDNDCDGEIDEENVCVIEQTDNSLEDTEDTNGVIEDEDPEEKNNTCTESTSEDNTNGKTYYIDSTLGNDSSDGITGPWKTLAKVNSFTFNPSDKILFKRGEVWREQFIPQSGDTTGYITYGAYGEGEKPLFLGSVKKNNTSDWTTLDNNIWRTYAVLDDSPLNTKGNELLINSNFDTDASYWSLHSEEDAIIKEKGWTQESCYNTSAGCVKFNIEKSGSKNNYIQFYNSSNITIKSDTLYLLTFHAKASKNFQIKYVSLIKQTSPWSTYFSRKISDDLTIGNSWKTYKVIFKANTDATDTRIDFYLGSVVPANTELYFDSISFQELQDSTLFNNIIDVDVANIIFNNEEKTGVKVFSSSELNEQGKFWYSKDKGFVKLYSTSNPASVYSDIELVLKKVAIYMESKSFIIYENLAIKYHNYGIAGPNNHDIIVRGCDFSYIGGADQYEDQVNKVRAGNGIEFWGNAHNILVERNKLWEIYDAALTPQYTSSVGTTAYFYNMIFRNNIIWNVEYCFEYWNHTTDSLTADIYFENNVCAFSGSGWAHNQRWDSKNGRHLMLYSNPAYTYNFFIRNNIFYESTESAIWWTGSDDVSDFIIDQNLYYESSGPVVRIENSEYDFANYVNITGLDTSSLLADPLFVNAANHDFHLQSNSPAIDTGIDNGNKADFDGLCRIKGNGLDLGAYEY
jgi:hypothetical protein